MLTTITPFPVSTPNVEPTSLTLGSDGNLWYPVFSGTQAGGIRGIGRITPVGASTDFTLVGGTGSPSALTLGPDGNLWFSEGTQIGRITPAGTITEFPLPSPAYAGGPLTAGPDGNLWFAETTGFAAGGIGRITPAGTITLYPLPGPGSPSALTVSPDGNLWFAIQAPGQAGSLLSGAIGKITPSGSITEFSLPAGSVPQGDGGMTVGSDGNLWFGAFFPTRHAISSGTIDRITPAAFVTEFPLPAGRLTGSPLTAGPGGNLWFSEGAKIGRITLAGAIRSFSLTKLPRHTDAMLGALTVGPDGNLYFPESDYLASARVPSPEGGRIDRITPKGTITRLPKPSAKNLPGTPGPLTVGSDGNLWFYETGISPSIDRVNL